MKKLFALLILCASLFAGMPAFADLADGVDAYEKGDYETALRNFQPLAEQGNIDAQLMLGKIYYNGHGVLQNYRESKKWYTRAGEQGRTHIHLDLGERYFNGEDAPQDYKEAIKWYRLAAEKGNVSAQHRLALMYDEGQGVQQDYVEAVRRYKLLAEQGRSDAQHNLALKYYLGQGVPQDYVIAHMWFNLIAFKYKGRGGSAEIRDEVAKEMTLEQIQQAQDLAQECLAKDYKGC